MPITADLQKASNHLVASDATLAIVIADAGLADFEPHTDYYAALVNSIIGQQLSVKAASTIKGRFKDLFDGQLPTPEAILSKSTEELRSAGLSGAKVNYVRDLAEHIIDGRIHFNELDTQTNEEIIANLTDVKGIGEWTVHMFLMFCMGRLDVLPTGDLGIRNGVRALYGFEQIPTPLQVTEIAEKNNWHPY
ncbi:MAG: DNA-3-methyladenine glycosylase, partial [Candidatus Saccharibacteria bacterium]|nr:DNA-3-methyladenine glycosylase [Candidatus Saccharibacteria bacterium]